MQENIMSLYILFHDLAHARQNSQHAQSGVVPSISAQSQPKKSGLWMAGEIFTATENTSL